MKKCKSCLGNLSENDSFCPHCGAPQEANLQNPPRKKGWIAGIIVLFLAIGVAVVYFSFFQQGEAQVPNKKTDPQPVEEAKKPAKPAHKKTDTVDETEDSLPVKELIERAFYSETVQFREKEAQLYILPAKGSDASALQDRSFLGEEGDLVYEGNLDFYLADLKEKKGYLQKADDEAVTINLDRNPFAFYTLGDRTIVTVTVPETSTDRTLHFWTYAAGKLRPIKIGDENVIGTSSSQLKVIDDTYIQMYTYYRDEPWGWIFDTYKWDPRKNKLNHFHERELLVESDYEWMSEEEQFEFYNGYVQDWQDDDNRFLTFPYIELPKDLAKRIEKGYITDEKAPYGSSLSDLFSRRPDHIGDFETEGGNYYLYSNGDMYFFDAWSEGDESDKIYDVGLQGSIATTKTELIELLGEPLTDDISDMEEFPSAMSYNIGNYHVSVYYEDEEFESISISSMD